MFFKVIPAGVDPYPCKTLTLQKGRGTSWVRVQVDIWTPAGTPLLITKYNHYIAYLLISRAIAVQNTRYKMLF